MNVRKSAADLLRDKYMSTQLKKTTSEKIHPDLNELYGVEYLKPEIYSKLYSPLFNIQKYKDLGTLPPKSILIRGINGVGKTYIVNCFCQHFQIDLITGYIETQKDIKELFSKSRASEKSIILIENVDTILKEDALMYQLNTCISGLNWCALVVIAHTDSLENVKYDGEIFVKIPTAFGRKELLDGIIKNMKTKDIDTFEISQKIPGFVPRDIVKLISMVSTRVVNRAAYQSDLDLLKQIRLSTHAQFSTSAPQHLTHTSDGHLCVTMDDFTSCIDECKNITQSITFDDIGALEKVKEELTMSILLPSRYPEKFISFGISRPSGVLLYGPPGCGKTLIAKAVSNMSHCNFLSIKGPELITKYVGDSEKHLRDLFQKAKNLSPCVLFFDEIDSLCGKRGKNEFGNRIVNQILTLLDGMEDRGEVYLIGATNRIDALDSALMRPGRFDKIIEVSLPDKEEALEIFKKCISKVPYEDFDFENLDLSGFSGADIAGVVKEAAIMCLKENFDSENLKVTEKYFLCAIEKTNIMKSTSKKSRNKARS
ncbi:uncharacterized protein VICG_00788 [Vittaforma corneae ATCC 50505]|uniref:AAA+ ATPase domain-containing protein n=1 Tax=Vittaforma corneae (strain ATCC 50505) TaxID=993615 RepID=L2GNT5_VITCO|nr:uncharacterized protein VICG_00788 [Vittaforma corneae ATCC 50505]ELA42145.1 hypothetical protein VICG_00788 [Vittaforma corneae ATCC 50505]